MITWLKSNNPFLYSAMKNLYNIFQKTFKIHTLTTIVKEFLLDWAAHSKFNAHIYYAVFSNTFTREQYAYLYGRMKYKKNIDSSLAHENYLLRRNVHRLEKGLLMKPRRALFAVDYIEETVDAYSKCYQYSSNSKEVRWASDVLSFYFQVVSHHPLVEKAKGKFQEVYQTENLDYEQKYIPYFRKIDTESPVSFEDLLALSIRRQSVRWYLPKQVPRDLIDKAIEIAAQSPSACNRQPFLFHIIDSPNLVDTVSQLPPGASEFAHNLPVLVVVVGKLRAYFDERDRHLIYIDAALASMSFMFALETLGLSSCPINWPDIEARERSMMNHLQLEPDERPIMVIALGYPDPEGLVASSKKKSLQYIRRYNFE